MDIQTLQQKMRAAHNAAQAAIDPAEVARHRQAASRFKQAIMQMQNQPAPQPAVAPQPQGGTVADSLGQGLSLGFSDEIAGVGGAAVNSLMNLFGKGTGESFGDAYQGIRDAARYNNEAFSARNPTTAMGAEIAGGLLTGGAGAARAGLFNAAKQTTPALMKAGALQGGLYGVGASDQDNAAGIAGDALTGATTGAVGGALGGLLTGAPAKVATALERTGARDAAQELYNKSLAVLKRNKIEGLTTGMRTGSSAVKATENSIAGTFVGGPLARRQGDVKQDLMRALMRKAGFNREDHLDGVLTSEALDRAKQKFDARYASALRGKTVKIDNRFYEDLGDVARTHSKFLEPHRVKEIDAIINEVQGWTADKTLAGRTYQQIRSTLGKRAQKAAGNPNAPTGSDALYRDIKHAFDRAAGRSSGIDLKSVNQDYARFTALRDAFQGVAQNGRGDIAIASLRNRIVKNPAISKDYKDLIEAANVVLSDAVPNSGTATRGFNLASLGGMTLNPAATAASLGATNIAARGLAGGVGSNLLSKGPGLLSQGVRRTGLLSAPVVNPQLLPPEHFGLLQ